MIFERYKKFASTFGPSGREGEICNIIHELIKDFVDEIDIDCMGNLIAHKHGTGDKIMLCAHMDTIGLVATFIDEKGFIRFSGVGGIDKYNIINAPVIFKNGTRGIVSFEEKTEIKNLKIENMYIDIGTFSKEETQKYVNVGDFVAFSSESYIVCNNIIGPYMDNRISCAILSLVIEKLKKSKDDLYFVFSVQEEVGLRGGITSSFAINPDIGIAIDVTDTGDTPKKANRMDVRLGDGPAIKIMDSSLICSPEIIKELEFFGKNLGTQREILTFGGTDAGAMQKSHGGALCGGISIPTRYIHSMQEMVNINDCEKAIDLIINFLENR